MGRHSFVGLGGLQRPRPLPRSHRAPGPRATPPTHQERIGKLLGVPGAELASLGPWGAAAAALAERLLAAAEQDPLFSVQLQTGAGLPTTGTPLDRLCDRLVSLSEQPAVQAKGLGRETALRLGAFRQIFQELSAIPDSTWVGGLRRDGRTDGPVTPFVRVAGATANRPLDITLRTTPFQSALSRDYRLDTSLKRNLAELRQTGRSWTNDRKLRIVSVRVHRQETHTEILLEAGRSRYEDYLCTHWAFADLPARATSRARAQLFKRGLLSDLDGPPHFPNQLGVSAFVVSKDGYILLPVQARSSVASAGLVVPSVSGSADWEPGYVDGNPIATQDIRREALEEMDLDHEHIIRVVPLALCRDLLRGGTPELFFVIFTSLDVGDLRLSLEHERIASSPQAVQNARMIPALLGADHTPFPGLEDRLVDYQRELEVTVDSLQERSPFVDALLHLYLEWCQPCLDRREDQA